MNLNAWEKLSVSHLHFDIKSIQFHFGADGIRCLVTFDSTHPEISGTCCQRQFEPDFTIMDILPEVPTFPEWIDTPEMIEHRAQAAA